MVIKSLSKRTSARKTFLSGNTRVSAGLTRVHVVDPTSLPDCELWYEGDKNFTGASIDSSSEPWVYDSIPNLGSLGGTFSSAAAARPMVGWIEADTVGRRVATFDYSNDYQDSSLASSNWKFTHDGTGCTVIVCVKTKYPASEAILSTNALALATVGTGFTVDADGSVVFQTFNGGGVAKSLFLQTAAGALDYDQPTILSVRHSVSDGGIISKGGISLVSAAYTSMPSPSDPLATLRFGALSTDALPWSGSICSIIAYSRYLSDAEVLAVEEYLEKYNVTVPVSQSPTFYYNLSATNDYTLDDGNAEAGDQIDRIRDLSGNVHDATQSTDAKQGTLGADSDSNAEVDVDGTADCYAVNAGIGWPAGTSHSFWFEYNPSTATGTNKWLLDFESGRFIITQLNNTMSDWFGINDGAWRNVATSVPGEQSLEIHVDDSGNTATGYRNGVFVGQAGSFNSRTMGGVVGLFANYTQDGSFTDCSLSELWARDSLQSDAEIFESRQYRAAKYASRWDGYLPLVVPTGTTGCWLDTTSADNFVVTGTYTGTNVVINGGFETGNPPSNWAPRNANTDLSQQLGTRTGGSGSYVMRVGCIITDSFTYATQSPLVVGLRYKIEGWTRGDGGNGVPTVYDGGGPLLWTGTNSTSWQNFSIIFTAQSTNFQLRCTGNVATYDYVEYDDIVIEEVEPIIVAKDKSKNQDDPVTNGDFETGDPPTSWVPNSGATLSAIAGTRTGGGGSQYMQISATPPDTFVSANQSFLTIGQRYLHEIWARGDGGSGYFRLSDTNVIITGTTSSTWTYYAAVSTAPGNTVLLSSTGDVAGHYVDVDDYIVTPGNHAYQATAANRPVYLEDEQCMRFTAASSQYMESGIIVNASGFTVVAWVNPVAVTGTFYRIFGSRDGTPDRAYIALWNDSTIYALAGSGAGNATNTSTDTVTAGVWQMIAVSMTPTESIIYLNNGVGHSSGAYAETLSTVEGYWGAENNNDASVIAGSYMDGSMSGCMYFPRVLSAGEIAYLYNLGRNP